MVQVLKVVVSFTRLLVEHADVAAAIRLDEALGLDVAGLEELKDHLVLSVVAQVEQEVNLERLADALKQQVDELLLLDAGRLHLEVPVAEYDISGRRPVTIRLPVMLLEHLLGRAVELLDEHVGVLRLGVLEVPQDARFTLLNERAVNVLGEALHDLAHLGLPREVSSAVASAVRITELLPLLVVAGSVQVARLGSKPEVGAVRGQLVGLEEPVLHGRLVVVAYDDDCVARVRHEAVQLLDDLYRGNRILRELLVRQRLHLNDDDASLCLEQVRVALIKVQLREVLPVCRHKAVRRSNVLAGSRARAQRHTQVVARQVGLIGSAQVD